MSDGDIPGYRDVSDLLPLLPRASLWLHGHIHDRVDYGVHGCRVVANPLVTRKVPGPQ